MPVEVILWRLFACGILAVGITSLVVGLLGYGSFYLTEGASEIVLALVIFAVSRRRPDKPVRRRFKSFGGAPESS